MSIVLIALLIFNSDTYRASNMEKSLLKKYIWASLQVTTMLNIIDNIIIIKYNAKKVSPRLYANLPVVMNKCLFLAKMKSVISK